MAWDFRTGGRSVVVAWSRWQRAVITAILVIPLLAVVLLSGTAWIEKGAKDKAPFSAAEASARGCPSTAAPPARPLLAFLPRPDLHQILDRIDLVQRAPHPDQQTALLAELNHVRRTGVVVNDEELESALRSIAVPVRSRSGEVLAAVNVAILWSPVAMAELVSQFVSAFQTPQTRSRPG